MPDNLNAKIKQLEKLINEKYVKATVFHLLKETKYTINCWKKIAVSTKIRNLIIESRIITTGALAKALFRRKMLRNSNGKGLKYITYIYIYLTNSSTLYIYYIYIHKQLQILGWLCSCIVLSLISGSKLFSRLFVLVLTFSVRMYQKVIAFPATFYIMFVWFPVKCYFYLCSKSIPYRNFRGGVYLGYL